MNFNKPLIPLFCTMTFIMSSCSSDSTDEVLNNNSSQSEIVISDDFITNSKDTIFENPILIDYSGDTVTITNPYASNGVEIANDHGNVVVKSTLTDTEVNYVLSGITKKGSLKVYSEHKFGLGFNGVSITSENGPAINIQSKKKVSATLVSGTSNRLVDGTTYTENADEDMKGTLFSEGQLNLDGSGTLQVYGQTKHAICCDDYVKIKCGNIVIKSAVKDGVHTKDYFRMDGGTLEVSASSNGIECEDGYIAINGGTIKVSSENDGIVASNSGTDASVISYISVYGGIVRIETTGEGADGLKSDGDISIEDGTITANTTGSAYYNSADADISSPAGIQAKGNFEMLAGTVTITSSGLGGKGINVDGTLTVSEGTLNVTTSGNRFISGNNNTASKAVKCDGTLTINGGNISLNTSKEEAEGLESKSILIINGGTIEVKAYDDCINAKNQILINGGSIYCYSTTNDGIDSNGTLTITDGTIVSSGSTVPEEGLDCDNNTFKITGGTIIGVGGASSTPTTSVCTQRSVVYSGTGTANQYVHIQSANGNDVLTFKVPRSYNQMTLLFSSSSLTAGTTYTIYTGDSISGGTDFNGLYTGAIYTSGTSAGTFTPTSMVSTVGNSNIGGGGGGGGGFRP